MIKFGNFDLALINFGTFRLDGGAMFGSVPKNIWAKRLPADDENCIPLATRCLLIETEGRKILVDVGLGEKWNDKSRQIFGIKNFSFDELKLDPASVTDIILTHLHFDHAGGISYFKGSSTDELKLTFPNATIYLQEDNYTNAKAPNLRERASYLKENVFVLEQAKLRLVRGRSEIFPGLWVHQVNGHTEGQQWIELCSQGKSAFYTTDLIPTSAHLPLPFVMGYDICVQTILREKEYFLREAVKREALVVFEHDPNIEAAKITQDEKGTFVIAETINIGT